MKLVIQRVTQAKVLVVNKTVGSIKSGFAVMVAFKHDDTKKELSKMANKLINLRIMSDDKGKMNLSPLDSKAGILLIPQFTLYADTKSRRPGFTQAAKPTVAKKLFEQFILVVKASDLKVETGQFGTRMKVQLTNDGPVTIILEN